jgi:iron complex outermembrane recepter protein
LKSELFERKIRVNAAIFKSVISDKQFDFTDTNNIFVVQPLNAIKDVHIDGIELEISARFIENLSLGLNYTYLDGDMPLQPHPNDSTATQVFELVQTPQHSGAFNIDYKLPPLPFGSLHAHLDISSTDRYAHSTVPAPSQDAYTLTNARLTLDELTLGSSQSRLSISLWGKNLTDEEYAILRFPLGTTTIQAFGPPRTYGMEISYNY